MEVGDLETECWSKEHKSHSGEHVLELASAIDHSNLQFSLPMTTCSLAKFTKHRYQAEVVLCNQHSKLSKLC